LAYLRGYKAYEEGTEEIQESMYADFISIHALELERFRFFVKNKNIATYNKACEDYQDFLQPNHIIDVGDQNSSEFFIDQIEKLLKIVI
jgi:hypothetical protein